jgi:acyl carrier protein
MNYAKEIRDFIVKNFLFGDEGSLQDDASFMRSSIIDSTGILELVTFLETTYNIHMENEEMIPGNLDSVNNVARYLERKTGAKATGAAPEPEKGIPEDSSLEMAEWRSQSL